MKSRDGRLHLFLATTLPKQFWLWLNVCAFKNVLQANKNYAHIISDIYIVAVSYICIAHKVQVFIPSVKSLAQQSPAKGLRSN